VTATSKSSVRRAAFVVGAALVPAALSLWGCNMILGIEEQGRRSDGADARGADAAPGGESCAQDSDCIAPDACYTPHCDTSHGRCWYGLCEVAGKACSAGSCNPTTRRCEGETDYGFRTTSFALTATPACTDPTSCVAALWPFVFIGTASGVVATFVDDPLASAARSLSVSGFDGPVTKLVASGSRLWILGALSASDAGSATLPIGFVDVPSDPTVRRLEATTTSFDFPLAAATAFPAPDGALYVSIDSPAKGFATALVNAPLPPRGQFAIAGEGAGTAKGPSDYTLQPASGVNVDAGVLAASSGDRLVVHSYPSTYVILASPGSPSARAEAPAVATFPPPLVPPSFAQGPDGALLLGGSLSADLPGDCNCTSVARARWLFANGSASTIAMDTAVDVEDYQNAQVAGQACHTCAGSYFLPLTRVAWLDSNRALVATAASDPSENRVRAAVRVVTRDPLGADPKRRFVLPANELPTGNFAAERIALTTDRGLGYLVVTSATQRSQLSVFDPRCESGLQGP
jgi:hypothetical protein